MIVAQRSLLVVSPTSVPAGKLPRCSETGVSSRPLDSGNVKPPEVQIIATHVKLSTGSALAPSALSTVKGAVWSRYPSISGSFTILFAPERNVCNSNVTVQIDP